MVPNGDRYPKPGLAPAAHRLAMVQAAARDLPGVEVLDVEVTSSTPMRTVKTMTELRERYPFADLYLLRGLDALPRTNRKLLSIPGLRVLVVGRPGARPLEQVLQRKPLLADNRQRVVYVADALSSPLSSTAVRRAVAQGQSVTAMVSPAVARLISELGLYNKA